MENDYIGTATYSPEDNKLRLYPLHRLDAETYARVKAAGFIWAPKQELFVAPAWGPGREDLLLELCGEIGDEDTSLVDRAEERAERFDGYSDRREADADAAQKAVRAIVHNIPFGQPILVGHHSERHARKNAERIENGMRKAVKMWETSKYWEQRAAGALAAAKYKERPDVRARRIKKLESERRRVEKNLKETHAFIAAWENLESLKRADGTEMDLRERAMHVANVDHISKCFTLADFPRDPPASQYEGMMSLWSALEGNVCSAEQAREIALRVHGRYIPTAERWLAHFDNRLAYERVMQAETGGTAADKTGPEKGGGVKCWASPRGGWSYVQKVNKVSVTVLDNWGNGGGNFTRTIPFDKLSGVMTVAQIAAAKEAGTLRDTADGTGFFIFADKPQVSTPTAAAAAAAAAPHDPGADFDKLKETLKGGVQVVAVPQLFETPRDLAARMIELADIRPGHRVLEPSAGTGALLLAVPGDTCRMAVEINPSLANATHLHQLANVRCADFLECNGDLGLFDRVVMNPPFEDGADIKHIEHARKMLKPGGRLVALCANGPRQREKLQPLADFWEDLPAGAFKEAGTLVNVALLAIEAPL